MAPTVPIDEDAAERLAALRAGVRLRTGCDVSERELVSSLIGDAHRSPGVVVDSYRSPRVPLSDDEVAAMRRGRFASGSPTDEEDVDDILYD